MENENQSRRDKIEKFLLDPDKVILEMLEGLDESTKQLIEAFQGVDLEKLETLRGEDGKTPERGIDYFTDEDLDNIEAFINSRIPKKEIDYPTPEQVNLYVDKKVKSEVSKLPLQKGEKGTPGKDGKPGENGSPDTAEQIIAKLRSLPKNKRLNVSDIRGLQTELNNIIQNQEASIEDVLKIINSLKITIPNIASGGMSECNWGNIGGDLDNQTDLKAVLDTKLEDIAGLITAGTDVSITGLGTEESPYVINIDTSSLVPGTRVITINGVSYDLSADRTWDITSGTSGYAANVYLTDLTSTTNGTYKQVSYTNDIATTTQQVTINNTESLIQTYIYDTDVEVTAIDAGQWIFNFYGKVSSTAGSPTLKFEVFKRTAGGTETTLFSKYSDVISNTTYARLAQVSSIQPQFILNTTDRLGIRIYGKNTVAASVTISYQVGDDTASWFNTPLKIKHNQLRDLSWLTSGHIGTANTLAGFNSSSISMEYAIDTDLSSVSANDNTIPSAKATKSYVDTKVGNAIRYQGAYDASGNSYPTTGGSGTAGAIMKGDMFVISVAGTLGGVAMQVGDEIIANIDTPGQTSSNWNTLNTNISYVPENVANKENTTLDTSTTKYPTNRLTKEYADGKVEDSIVDGHTTIAPSGNAVFDALAGKQATMTKATQAEVATGTDDTKYVTPLAVQPYSNNSLYRQAVINGNFDVWQRGTSLSLSDTDNVFLADKFREYLSDDGGTLPTLTRSREILTIGSIYGSNYYTRLTTNGAGSSLGPNSEDVLYQNIENGVSKLAGDGKTVTLSFYARSSIANKKIGIALEQKYGTGGSPSAIEVLKGGVINLSSNWTKYTITFTTNTLVGKTFGTNNDDALCLDIWYMWGATMGNNKIQTGVSAETFVGAGTIDIAQVQLNAGSVALPFQPKSYAEELRDCQTRNDLSIITSSSSPSIDIDKFTNLSITALAEAITSFTVYGAPYNFQKLIIRIKDNGTARAITWGTSFEAKGVALPTTTVISKVLTVGFIYDTVTSKWGCVASAQEA